MLCCDEQTCQKVNQTLKNKKRLAITCGICWGIKKAEEIRLILLTKCACPCRMRRERLIRPTKVRKFINCRIHVGLISEAHQAFLLLHRFQAKGICLFPKSLIQFFRQSSQSPLNGRFMFSIASMMCGEPAVRSGYLRNDHRNLPAQLDSVSAHTGSQNTVVRHRRPPRWMWPSTVARVSRPVSF